MPPRAHLQCGAGVQRAQLSCEGRVSVVASLLQRSCLCLPHNPNLQQGHLLTDSEDEWKSSSDIVQCRMANQMQELLRQIALTLRQRRDGKSLHTLLL